MGIVSFSRVGYSGELVTVEVDIRRGIPGVTVVGLPDGAVRESTERIRAAIRNSGYEFPASRLLVNLAPASLRKEGGSFDLPIAMAILLASGQAHDATGEDVLVMGELELSGRLRPVPGILAAVSRAAEAGCGRFVVPGANLREAAALGLGLCLGPSSLAEAAELLALNGRSAEGGGAEAPEEGGAARQSWEERALSGFLALSWPPLLYRAILAAAAGGHHILLAGPPGVGKTLAGKRLVSLLPDLDRSASLEVSRIHSLAGLLSPGEGLLRRPPLRSPHHSASLEGMVGGGRNPRPGEISLAHRGVLFLDEAPEFARDILQALREPTEEGFLTISRAQGQVRYPAAFQLVMAANPCPCGNLGRKGRACLCSLEEVERYWRRLGGALLDRIDIRIPVISGTTELGPSPSPGNALGALRRAWRAQEKRYEGMPWHRNARLAPEAMGALCELSGSAASLFRAEAERRGLSTRSRHALARLSRSLADLGGREAVGEEDVSLALELRGIGEADPADGFFNALSEI